MSNVSIASPSPSSLSGPRYHWRYLIAAPHRIFFFGGVWAMVLAVLWWGAVLLARHSGVPHPPAELVPQWLHSWLMVLGSFIFFVFGFGMTAVPRWLGMPPLPAKLYTAVALALMLAFVLVFVGGLFNTAITLTGMIIAAVAWFTGAGSLALWWVKSPSNSKIPPLWTISTMFAGGFVLIAEIYGLGLNKAQALALAPEIGVWAFLGPIIFAVFHRVGPFFAKAKLGPTYEVYRPLWAPFVVIPLLWLHAALMIAGLNAWLFVIDIPLTLVLGWFMYQWQPYRAYREPLLWSLFVAFTWFLVATVLSSIQSLALFVNQSHILGLAPLHAMAIGLAASMVFAMATRVSMGHSGRPLVMGKLVTTCFIILQLSVLCRVCAEIDLPVGDRGLQLVMSTVFWLIAFIPWAVKFSLIYWQPRADGRPG